MMPIVIAISITLLAVFSLSRFASASEMPISSSGGNVPVQKPLSNTPRGIANNNPGNIRRTGDAWQGLSDTQTDKDYFQFVSPEYGIRAMTKILKRYYETYSLVTVQGIIIRWSPANENPTSAYINYVAGCLGVAPTATINFNAVIKNLVKAIIKFENGIQPYSDPIIIAGLNMAGIVNA